MNAEDIQAVLRRIEVVLVPVDQGDLVSFQGETFTEEVSNLTGSDDKYIHQ